MLVAAFTSSDLWRVALAVFLLAVGLSIAFFFVRLGGTVARLSSLISGAEREVLPVVNKVGGSVDRVNTQLDKLDTASDSGVDAVVAVDEAVRSVSYAVKTPVKKLAGLSAGVAHGWASLRTRRSWSEAVAEGKEAAARREQDLEQELKAHGG